MKTLGNPSSKDICGFVTTTAYKRLEHENAKLQEQVTQLRDDWESERDYANQMEDMNHDLKFSLALALHYLNFVCEHKEFCINCPLNRYLKRDKYGKIIGGCEVLDLINKASKFGIKVGD